MGKNLLDLAGYANPYLLMLRVGLVAASGLAVYAAGYYHAHKGKEDALVAQGIAFQAKFDTLLNAYNVLTEKSNAEAARNSVTMAAGIKDLTANLNLENQNAKAKPTKPLVLPSSTNCLGVQPSAQPPSEKRTSVSLQSNSNTGVTPGTIEKAQCQLDDATGEAIYELVQEGDEAIRQLNSVIDAYNLVQKIGCAVTLASDEELDSLLRGTELQPSDVSTQRSLTLEVIKAGVISIIPSK